MRAYAEELDDVERCRQARRKLERRYRTLAGLCAHLRQLEKRRGRNMALGSRMLRTSTSGDNGRRTRAGRAVSLVVGAQPSGRIGGQRPGGRRSCINVF